MTCKRFMIDGRMTFLTSFSDEIVYRIQVDGRRFRFEFSKRFGPFVLGKRGQVLEGQPGPRSKFWWAVSSWVGHGKRVDDDGLCIWFRETEDILKHMRGRNYLVVGETEPVRGA